jgi:hypothetical protein
MAAHSSAGSFDPSAALICNLAPSGVAVIFVLMDSFIFPLATLGRFFVRYSLAFVFSHFADRRRAPYSE